MIQVTYDLIEETLHSTKKTLHSHTDYPRVPGLYAFFLSENADKFEYATPGQIMYIGISKDSLHDRDFNQHFKTGKTGSSTLRRSIGAIMKNQLNLTAIPRGGENDSKRFENYKFSEEQKLTDWMVGNLKIGYWVPASQLSYTQLRGVEMEITKLLKPLLDLDHRTKRFNPFAGQLVQLRNICKKEAGKI